MTGDIAEFLQQEVWAVVGVSANPDKYGTKVYHQLRRAGYTVYPVNPKLASLDGERCYPSLNKLPHKPDAVSVVVPPQVTEQVVEQCADLGITRVWMQPGSESDKAIQAAEEKGLQVIHNQCVLIQTQSKIKGK